MTDNYNLAAWYVYALTGSVDTPVDWRCIHDQRKDLPGHNYRGTLAECWQTLQSYNAQGYGIFASINAMKPVQVGEKRTLEHVEYIRAHVVDLDGVTAPADYQRAVEWGGAFAVQSSPNKFHVYFKVQPYVGNDFYSLQQRRLNQLFNGDKKVVDATRVMRVPGFMHQKGAPVLVTGWQLSGFNNIPTAEQFGQALAHINVVEHFSARQPLGTADMSAPSLEWLRFALSLLDPNDLDRGEWLSISAAFKQAGWSHADEETLLKIWSEWCAQYRAEGGNDEGENLKLWNSINDTETGWATFERRTPVKAYMQFSTAPAPVLAQNTKPEQSVDNAPVPQMPSQPAGSTDDFHEILGEHECKEWFKNCYFVERTGQIFSPAGRFMNSTQFNGRYGGKVFIITSNGKVTDEPWKAALRSTCWTIPKVDHVRFLPDRPKFDIVIDSLGRRGLNTYIPAIIDARPGDLTLWFDWFNRILPNPNDQKILFEYMAHCVKYPGYKIPWAPMLQSAEGIGKTIFREVMAHSLGDMYVYSPKAPELVKSGSTFNAWMRGKLMIIVDEIKIDERRELIEILKPMITDNRVEIQSKGVDQDMEDNPANWLFFSNYKDAIPISQNGRRYSIFYSALQSAADIDAAGMGIAYFNRLWKWLRDEGGLQAIAHWLLNYPVERGALPVRAPETSSHAEALKISRSPMEVVIAENVGDDVPGFRGGYVSTIAAISKAKAAGIRSPSARTVQVCLENMGYTRLGRATRAYFQEGPDNRADIYGLRSDMSIDLYGRAQGYE